MLKDDPEPLPPGSIRRYFVWSVFGACPGAITASEWFCCHTRSYFTNSRT